MNLIPKLRQNFQGLQIHRGLRQPHALRMAAESFFKIANAPKNLRVFVLARGQRKDHVVVGLGHRRTMAGEKPLAFAVGRQNRFIHRRTLLLHPRKQGGTKVEADLGIVVDDLQNAAIAIQNPRGAVGRITFRRDPLVPVVIRISRILVFHRFQPGIFPRRLVKVGMNADVPFHQVSRIVASVRARRGASRAI